MGEVVGARAGDGITLRHARLADAALYAHLVHQHGGSTPRLGWFDVTDEAAVARAMWHHAAAVFVAEVDARPVAVATVFDLTPLHQTAWIEVIEARDVARPTIDSIVDGLLRHAFATWPIRAIRTADPVGREPLLAGLGDRVRHEGRLPGRCPGVGCGDGEIRAIWRSDLSTPGAAGSYTDRGQSRAR